MSTNQIKYRRHGKVRRAGLTPTYFEEWPKVWCLHRGVFDDLSCFSDTYNTGKCHAECIEAQLESPDKFVVLTPRKD